MRKLLSIALIPLLLLLVISSSTTRTDKVFAAAADHIVISEIQIDGALSNSDDFIELYNPTDSDIDLTNYRLVKRTSTGTEDTGIIAFEEGDIIPSNGYFLWCNNAIESTLSCDRSTSATISNNNSIGLRDGELNEGTLIDSVTFGTPANPLGEGTFITTLPTENQSIERKALSTSTAVSLADGGEDELKGNAEDTNNNSADFVLQTTSFPQNSSSAIEVPASQTVTGTPSDTPTVTITLTPTSTPTMTPSLTPTLTTTPTVSATPTTTAIPTTTLTPTATLTPTVTLTPTPSVKPVKARIIGFFPLSRKVCYITYSPTSFFFMFPKINCINF